MANPDVFYYYFKVLLGKKKKRENLPLQTGKSPNARTVVLLWQPQKCSLLAEVFSYSWYEIKFF